MHGAVPMSPKDGAEGHLFRERPYSANKCWLGLSFQLGSVLRTGPMGALGPRLKWDAMNLKGFFQGLGHRVR